MSRTLWTWLLGAADDTAQAAIMLVLAGAAVSLAERPRPPENEARYGEARRSAIGAKAAAEPLA
jgi:hypothetical protein